MAALSGDALAARNEMDEFTEKMTPELIGNCTKQDGDPWCVTHTAYWPVQMDVCLYARDLEAFADRLLEAWEKRHKTEQDPTAPHPVGET